MDEWINKLCYIYTTKYYSVIKRNEVLIHATTWMNLEIIMLRKEASNKRHMLYDSFIKNVQNIHRNRKYSCKGWGWDNRVLLLVDTGFLFV